MRACVILLIAVMLSGCSTLLPKTVSETPTVWKSYEEAKAVFDTVVPHITTRNNLRKLNIDPYQTAGITILTYADVLQRFNADALLQSDQLEEGLSSCLRAGKRCSGYLINQRRVKRDRVGNFFADSFRFKQETEVSGWSFNGTILFVDDIVVYTLYGGQPVIKEKEVVKNPLGLLQNWAETAKSLVSPIK